MALYRINQRSALFGGFVGDLIRAEPDPMMNAAVRSGVLSRMDVEVPQVEPEPEEPQEDTEAEDGEPPRRKRKK